jgi:hypothetical protein
MVLYAHRPSNLTVFHLYPVAPKDSRDQVPYDVSKNLPTINVGVTKTPTAIAKDIERRLLTVWEPRYKKALERIAESNEYVETSLSVVEKIAQVVGIPLPSRKPGDMHKRVSFDRSPHPIFSGLSSSAEILGDSVRLELVLAPDDAVTLLKFMVKS